MQIMTGGNTINTLRKAMELIDERLAKHGDRVAYILYHMLKSTGGYSKTALDKFLIIGLLHDIGAYKTDEMDAMLTFDCSKVWGHSIYGYLYLRYLSPLNRCADILLYHHLDYFRFEKINYELKEISMCLNVADRADINLSLNNGDFKKRMMEEGRYKKFYPKALDMLYRADVLYRLFVKLNNGQYLGELEQLISEIELTEEEIHGYLKLMVYSIDFMHEDTVHRTANTNIVCGGLCKQMKLGEEEESILYYSSLLYDVGMLAVPQEILDAPRKLTDSERQLVESHVVILRKNFEGIIPEKILKVAEAHHERLDGSGYPRHMKEEQITILQKILQIADMIGALSCKNSRRDKLSHPDIVKTLLKEAEEGRLDKGIVDRLLKSNDNIQEYSGQIHGNAFQYYDQIKDQYELIMKRFEQYNV